MRNGNGGVAGSEEHHNIPRTLPLHVDIGKIRSHCSIFSDFAMVNMASEGSILDSLVLAEATGIERRLSLCGLR